MYACVCLCMWNSGEMDTFVPVRAPLAVSLYIHLYRLIDRYLDIDRYM